VVKKGREGDGTIAGVAMTVYFGWLGMEDSCHQVISTTFIIPRRLNHFFMPNGMYHRAELPICRTEASSTPIRHKGQEMDSPRWSKRLWETRTMSSFVISDRARGAGRNRFSPNNGEMKYSLSISSVIQRRNAPKYRICQHIE